jgi:hypothetical protein
MARIETLSGYCVELSGKNYLRACDGDRCAFTAADNVVNGMMIELLATNGSVVSTMMIATNMVRQRGFYNPHTIAGDIIVASKDTCGSIILPDIHGIVVSDTSEWFAEGYVPEAYIPHLYHAVLSPVRQLYAISPSWLTRFNEQLNHVVQLLTEKADTEQTAAAGSVESLLE